MKCAVVKFIEYLATKIEIEEDTLLKHFKEYTKEVLKSEKKEEYPGEGGREGGREKEGEREKTSGEEHP